MAITAEELLHGRRDREIVRHVNSIVEFLSEGVLPPPLLDGVEVPAYMRNIEGRDGLIVAGVPLPAKY